MVKQRCVRPYSQGAIASSLMIIRLIIIILIKRLYLCT